MDDSMPSFLFLFLFLFLCALGHGAHRTVCCMTQSTATARGDNIPFVGVR
jgi:hypothetical protein